MSGGGGPRLMFAAVCVVSPCHRAAVPDGAENSRVTPVKQGCPYVTSRAPRGEKRRRECRSATMARAAAGHHFRWHLIARHRIILFVLARHITMDGLPARSRWGAVALGRGEREPVDPAGASRADSAAKHRHWRS